MIEIQCTSCQTRYRIDERILPDETPTFKCSRCGHVFSAEPRGAGSRRAGAQDGRSEAPAEANPAASAAAPDAAPKAAAAKPAASAPKPAASAPVPPGAGRPSEQPAVAHEAAQDDADLVDSVAPADEAAPVGGNAEKPAESQADPRRAPERPFGERPLHGLRDRESDDASYTQDNLSFDFSDEARETFIGLETPKPNNSDNSDKWEVGEPSPPSPPRRPAPRKASRFRAVDVDDTPGVSAKVDQISHEETSAAAQRLEAEFRGRSSTIHSAGFFLGIFALLIFAFGLVTLVICGAPIASAQVLSTLPMIGPSLQPPVSPAERVAFTNVQAHYATITDNENALIINGTAENVSMGTLGAVQIGAALIGPEERLLSSRKVYCGNNLSPTMVSEMTPQELDFFEKLGGPKNFSLAPQATTPFVIVFVAPPTEATRFQLRVARAEPISAAVSESTGS